jgi:hypothetical protein
MTFLMCFGVAQYVVLSALLGAGFSTSKSIEKRVRIRVGIVFAIFWPGIIIAKFIAQKGELNVGFQYSD